MIYIEPFLLIQMAVDACRVSLTSRLTDDALLTRGVIQARRYRDKEGSFV